MRLFVFGPDLTVPQPVWMSIFWPHYQALSQCISTTFLTCPIASDAKTRLYRKLDFGFQRRTRAPGLVSRVKEHLDPNGPNILLVYALNSWDANCSTFLDDVWEKFDYRVLNLVDTLQPDHSPKSVFSRFDLILSFCSDLAEEFERQTGVPSLYFPPHCDTLAYHSLRESRPIDLILVGRRDAARHAPLHRHFNEPGQDRVFLDFVTRTQSTPLAEEEFGLLMATYSRSKATFCYEASSLERFRNRSPLTGRWIHAWLAGCTVLGTAPKAAAAADQMDWPEAAIDLPEEPHAAIEAVEAILADSAALSRRRRRNVVEVMGRHDTRIRLRDLLIALDLPVTDSHEAQLERLNRARSEIAILQ